MVVSMISQSLDHPIDARNDEGNQKAIHALLNQDSKTQAK